VANVSQIITIDKGFLREKCATIKEDAMTLIEDGMRLVLAL
jgi:mRNA interferase MazF